MELRDKLWDIYEKDVPGAKLPNSNLEMCNRYQLSRWLQCRGLKKSGNKPDLIDSWVLNIISIVIVKTHDLKWIAFLKVEQAYTCSSKQKFPKWKCISDFQYAKIKLLYDGEIITVRSQKLTTVRLNPIFYNSYEDVCVN